MCVCVHSISTRFSGALRGDGKTTRHQILAIAFLNVGKVGYDGDGVGENLDYHSL